MVPLGPIAIAVTSTWGTTALPPSRAVNRIRPSAAACAVTPPPAGSLLAQASALISIASPSRPYNDDTSDLLSVRQNIQQMWCSVVWHHPAPRPWHGRDAHARTSGHAVTPAVRRACVLG